MINAVVNVLLRYSSEAFLNQRPCIFLKFVDYRASLDVFKIMFDFGENHLDWIKLRTV